MAFIAIEYQIFKSTKTIIVFTSAKISFKGIIIYNQCILQIKSKIE